MSDDDQTTPPDDKVTWLRPRDTDLSEGNGTNAKTGENPGTHSPTSDDSMHSPSMPVSAAANGSTGQSNGPTGAGGYGPPAANARGKLEAVRTWLEMTRNPQRTPRPPRIARLSIMRAHNPTVDFYRFLYHTIGERWLWYERRAMSDTELANIIQNPAIHLYVLYSAGVPAGYTELKIDDDNDNVEIAYFGLMPDFIGQRLGPYFLDWAIARAWGFEPERVTLNTCTLDHPKAVVIYQQAGFTPVAQEHFEIDDPRLDQSLGFKPVIPPNRTD